MAKSSVKITRLKFHYDGFDAVRSSPDVVGQLEERGAQIAQAAMADGGEVMTATSFNKSRGRVRVFTADMAAMKAEAENRSLSRALDAGRG